MMTSASESTSELVKTEFLAQPEPDLRQLTYRQLHDGLGLELTLLSIRATQLSEAARAWTGPQDAKKQALSSNVSEQVSRVLSAFRATLNELNCAVKDPQVTASTLPTQLQALVDLVGQAQKIQGNFVVTQWRTSVPAEKCEALLMGARELLNNMVKHAKADTFQLELSSEKHQLSLRLTDNGAGFASNVAGQKESLKSLKDRLAAYQGTAAIDAAPGRGSCVTLSVPCGEGSFETTIG